MKSLLSIMAFNILITSSFAMSKNDAQFSSLEKKALKSYVEKQDNQDAELSMRQVNKLIKTKGTYENKVINEIVESCHAGNSNCSSDLTSAMKNMYSAKSTKLLNASAYICAEIHGDSSAYHLLAFGRNKSCGITTIGPGLVLSAITLYGMICTHEKQGLNVGVFANVDALIGLGFGVTAGRTGLCTVFNMNIGSVGAFAGAIIINNKKFI